MTLTHEQRAALSAQAKESELSPETEARVLALLGQEELSDDEVQEIRDLIQADIDTDLAAIPGFLDEIKADPEYEALVADNEKSLAAIEEDLNDSMAIVDAETRKLDAAVDQLDSLMTEARIDAVKGNLGVS